MRQADEAVAAHVFIVAGEPSGDLLGAHLMRAMQKRAPGPIRFSGVGGPRMTECGLRSLFAMDELALFGLAEIIPRLARLRILMRRAVDAAHEDRPDIVVTIDSPGFNHRLCKRLRDLDRPLVHYVAPSVWAWKPGRAKKLAHIVDHLLTLLPFEPPYFEREGLASTFVGHPILDYGAADGDGPQFRQDFSIAPESPVLIVLPGSRRGEVVRLLPVFESVVRILVARDPRLRIVVPTVGTVGDIVRQHVGSWPGDPLVVLGDRQKYDAFAAADAAVAASGTVSLELAIAGVPTVVTYKVNPLTAAIVRRVLRTRFVSLVNVLEDQEVVPEFLQKRCRPDLIVAALTPLLAGGDAAARQRKLSRAAIEKLRAPGGATPADVAAQAVFSVLEGWARHRPGLEWPNQRAQ